VGARLDGYDKAASGSHRLLTSAGEIECDIVINAAGPWAGKIAGLLGVQMPVIPQVHEVVQVKLPRELGYVVPMVNLYMPGMAGEALYFRQDGPDSLIAGMHTYLFQAELSTADPDSYRKKVSEEYLYAVAETLSERFLVDDLGFKPGWTGLYPISPDGQFMIGPHAENPTIIAAGGMGGVGVTSGSIVGFAAAEWALQGSPTTVPGLLAMDVNRFADTHTHDEVSP
jgi:glycine/D-amino acid oxidase-like deaminating enzyme